MHEGFHSIWLLFLLLQLLQRSWACRWRALSSPGTGRCVRSRAPRCRTSSGSARTTCWRALCSGRWLRAPPATTTPSASWETWSQANSTPAAPPTHWVKSRPPCMSCPPSPLSLWPGLHLLSCSSCQCLWGQKSSCWWGWGCGWCRAELCRGSAAGGNDWCQSYNHGKNICNHWVKTVWSRSWSNSKHVFMLMRQIHASLLRS